MFTTRIKGLPKKELRLVIMKWHH